MYFAPRKIESHRAKIHFPSMNIHRKPVNILGELSKMHCPRTTLCVASLVRTGAGDVFGTRETIRQTADKASPLRRAATPPLGAAVHSDGREAAADGRAKKMTLDPPGCS